MAIRHIVIFVIFLFVLFMIKSSIIGRLKERINTLTIVAPSIHLVTGLLVNGNDGWNGKNNRENESGFWLLDPLLKRINKTVYNSDIYLTIDDVMSSSALDRFSNKTWQEYIVKSLLNRNDIDLRPIAQYKRSQECPYYLTYIIDNYDHLPEILLFSHGRPQAHNPNIVKHWSWFIDQVYKDTKRTFFNSSIGFLSANCGVYVERSIKSRPILDLLGYSRTIEPLSNQIKSLSVGTYCCAQFIVHRSRILLHPISFWRLSLKIVIDINDCSHFEHLWHIFFSEPDKFDPRKTVANWYKQAHTEAKEQCPTTIMSH